MSGKAVVVLAITTALSFLGTASAVANDMDGGGHGGKLGGSVVPTERDQSGSPPRYLRQYCDCRRIRLCPIAGW